MTLPAVRPVSSSIGASAISRPRPITTRWSAVSAISVIRWLDTNTVRPSAASALKSVRTHTMPSGSRPLTGSSNMRIGGSPSSAAAMPRRWLMPSEKLPRRRPATSCRPTSASTSSTRLRGMRLLCARHQRWASARRPPCAALASRSAPTSYSGNAVLGVGAAVHRDRAAGRAVEAEDQAHRGGLAGAVGAEEAGDPAGRDVEVEMVDGGRRPVPFREAACLDHRAVPSRGWGMEERSPYRRCPPAGGASTDRGGVRRYGRRLRLTTPVGVNLRSPGGRRRRRRLIPEDEARDSQDQPFG